LVTVAPVFQLKHHYWKFPFVGKVPYKGFATPEEADEEAKNFPEDKYDVYIRGASAYSTLGWFDDPILSSMLNYRKSSLVNLIIHETVHATVYIKDNADFNERLATFIGNKGAEYFYLKKEGDNSKTLENIKLRLIDEKIFSDFISKEIDDLKKWYKDNRKKVTFETKEKRISEILQRYEKDILPKFKTKRYQFFTKTKLNNARLLAIKTYVYDLSDFQKMYDLLGKDFKKLVTYAKTLEDADHPGKKLKQDIAKIISETKI